MEWRGIARKGGTAREGRRGLAQGAVHASCLPRVPPQAVDPNRSFNPRGEVVAGRSFNPEVRRMLPAGGRLSLALLMTNSLHIGASRRPIEESATASRHGDG